MNLQDYDAARRRFRQQVGRDPASFAELRSTMLLEDLQRRYNLANPEDEDRQPTRPIFLRNRRRPWK